MKIVWENSMGEYRRKQYREERIEKGLCREVDIK